LLKFEEVDYRYNDANNIKALENISFELKKGSSTSVVGHVGCGKTTLAILLSGLIKPSSGRVLFNGKIIGKEINQHQIWQKIGFVQQQSENQIFESTVENEIAFALKNAGIESIKIDEIVTSSLENVGLDSSFKKRSPLKLSGGEKRLIAISSIIAYDPEVLIFDEPTVGLDGDYKRSVIEYIKSVKDEKTIILITHDPDEMLICDDLMALSNGKLIVKGEARSAIKENFTKIGLPLPGKWKFLNILRKCKIDVSEEMNTNDLLKLLEENYEFS
jgi:energy-coupling factor transport system ATP-binding protein